MSQALKRRLFSLKNWPWCVAGSSDEPAMVQLDDIRVPSANHERILSPFVIVLEAN